MAESFNYGRALADAESKTTRAATRDAKAVCDMSLDELQSEHAKSQSATRAQEIRNELRARNAL